MFKKMHVLGGRSLGGKEDSETQNCECDCGTGNETYTCTDLSDQPGK